jgi:hypothetical protein
MWAFSTRNIAKAHLILPPHQSKLPYPSQWEVAMQSAMDFWCHQSKGENLDKSEADTCTSDGFYGPQMYPNRLQTAWTPGTTLRIHQVATTRKHKGSGAHRGSADPTGRPNRPCGRQSPPSMWWLLVGYWAHSKGVWGVLTKLPSPYKSKWKGVRIGHTLLLLILPLGFYLSRRGVPLHRISAGLLVLRD